MRTMRTRWTASCTTWNTSSSVSIQEELLLACWFFFFLPLFSCFCHMNENQSHVYPQLRRRPGQTRSLLVVLCLVASLEACVFVLLNPACWRRWCGQKARVPRQQSVLSAVETLYETHARTEALRMLSPKNRSECVRARQSVCLSATLCTAVVRRPCLCMCTRQSDTLPALRFYDVSAIAGQMCTTACGRQSIRWLRRSGTRRLAFNCSRCVHV